MFTPPHKDHYFEMLLKKIYELKGLDFTKYRPACFKRRVDSRLIRTGVQSYKDYLKIINSDPEEINKLCDAATINLTEFYRDSLLWDELRKKYFPELIQRKTKRASHFFSFWSAGSSGGEEAYTISILLNDLLKEEFRNKHIRIFGTDIDDRSLQRASYGEYRAISLKNLPKIYLKKYFQKLNENFLLCDSVRLPVSFKKQNMIQESPSDSMDFIFCRNVMIYFSKEIQLKVIQNFHKSLNTDGYLILGLSETLLGVIEPYFELVDQKRRIYKKK